MIIERLFGFSPVFSSLSEKKEVEERLDDRNERDVLGFLQCVFSEEKKEVEDRKLREERMYWLFSSECVCSQPVSFPAPSSHLIGSWEREGMYWVGAAVQTRVTDKGEGGQGKKLGARSGGKLYLES